MLRLLSFLFICYCAVGCSNKVYQQELKPEHHSGRLSVKALFMDGTMNKPTKDTNENTNVLTMFNMVKPGVPGYYVEGVGNNAKVLGMMFGVGMGRRVRYAYRYLAANYKPRDSIFIVGFSRGAFSARVLTNLIYVAGIPSFEHFKSGRLEHRAIRKLYNSYHGNADLSKRRRRVAKTVQKWNAKRPGKKIELDTSGRVRIEALALYETVEALGAPDYVEEFKPRNSSHLYQADNVNHVFHALALDDNRAQLYTPVLFTYPQIQQCTSASLDSIVEEVWFAGSHSDIGGSMRKRPEIRYTSLNWMLSRLSRYGIFQNYYFKESNYLPVNNMQATFFKYISRHNNRDIPRYLETIASCYNSGKINVHESVMERIESGNMAKFKSRRGRPDWYGQPPFDSCFVKNGDQWQFDRNCKYIKISRTIK